MSVSENNASKQYYLDWLLISIMSLLHHLHQMRLCGPVSWFFVCDQNNWKSCIRISRKFSGLTADGARNTRLTFWHDPRLGFPDHDAGRNALVECRSTGLRKAEFLTLRRRRRTPREDHEHQQRQQQHLLCQRSRRWGKSADRHLRRSRPIKWPARMTSSHERIPERWREERIVKDNADDTAGRRGAPSSVELTEAAAPAAAVARRGGRCRIVAHLCRVALQQKQINARQTGGRRDDTLKRPRTVDWSPPGGAGPLRSFGVLDPGRS